MGVKIVDDRGQSRRVQKSQVEAVDVCRRSVAWEIALDSVDMFGRKHERHLRVSKCLAIAFAPLRRPAPIANRFALISRFAADASSSASGARTERLSPAYSISTDTLSAARLVAGEQAGLTSVTTVLPIWTVASRTHVAERPLYGGLALSCSWRASFGQPGDERL
jgi:hypothetical protein